MRRQQEKRYELVWGFLFLISFSYKKRQRSNLCRFCYLDKACDKDLKTDGDQDDTAEDTRLTRKSCANSLADLDADKTNDERNRRDQKRCEKRFRELIFRDRKANGKRVDGSGDTLHDKSAEGDRAQFRITALALEAIDQHFDTDVAKQDQSDPRNKLFKRRKYLNDRMDTNPTKQGHQTLKECKKTGNTAHLADAHSRFVQTVGKRYGKSIHRKTNTEHDAHKKEIKSQIHVFNLRCFDKIKTDHGENHARTS